MNRTQALALATAMAFLVAFVAAPTLWAADREPDPSPPTATSAVDSTRQPAPDLTDLLLTEAGLTPTALGAGPVGCSACLWGCMQEFNACRHSCDGGGWQECLDCCVTQQEYCQNIECAPACGY